MVRITEDLVRKRAEHNEGIIYSLQELSLHQLHIERLESLDRWCPDLEILYLQNNLIPKIENIRRLKKLKYLNLTLNNIVRIENTEGCESLTKLDLTLNFIGELTSISNLVANYNLQELFLTGNPCTTYDGYRQYVIAVLPQLKYLDGIVIERSERIEALQNFERVKKSVLILQQQHLTNMSSKVVAECQKEAVAAKSNSNDSFWNQLTDHSPETRIRIYEEIKKTQQVRSEPKIGGVSSKTLPRKLFTNDGRALNINEPKVQFTFLADDDNKLVLDVAVYKYLDTSLIKVDLQPTYVQVRIRTKLALHTEISPDQSVIQRSAITGHLLITMAKASDHLKTIAKQSSVS